MPRIARLASTQIAMYFADHPPPHFHVLGSDGQAQIAIATFEVLETSGRIDVRDGLEWAVTNQAKLLALWNEYSGEANDNR